MRAVCDCEVLSNFFSCTFIDFDSDECIIFEISERKNEIVAFVEFVMGIKYMIGFNSSRYDSPIIMYILKNIKVLQEESWDTVTQRIKSLSDCIIDDEEGSYKKYSKYKYPHYCQVDLFMYWSKLTRVSRKLSLKSFAINLNWPRIQEFPLHHTALIRPDQIDGFLSYNINDVLVTKALAKKMSRDINLRVDARKRYGFECLSWDGVKLGLNIAIKRYCDRTGRDMQEVNQLRTHRSEVAIRDILLPIIDFQIADATYIQFIEKGELITQFKSFYGLWQYLQGLVVTNASSINCRVVHNGIRYDHLSGGAHTYHNPGISSPGLSEVMLSVDVISYYPSIMSQWYQIPEHLGRELAEEIEVVKQERVLLKSQGLGKSTQSDLIKLSLNSLFGNLNNDYTPVKDLKAFLGVCINGQMMLLMLCGRLINIGARIDENNTDGTNFIIAKDRVEEARQVCKEWEVLTKMQLEEVEYKRVIRMNINNYLCFYEGGVKEKGMFLTDPPIDMSRDFLVIPKAIRAYYEFGTPIEQYIREHKEIYNFCGSMKVDC